MAPRTTLRVNSALLAVAVVVAAIGLTTTADKSGPRVTLRTGTFDGVAWQLDAQEQDGQLCLTVGAPGAPGSTARGFAGACGFANDPSHGGGYYASGPGPNGSYVNYGPVPSSAMSVRVATNETVLTYALPARASLPAGRYWIDFESATWPSAQQGTAVPVQPLDAAGHDVPFQKF